MPEDRRSNLIAALRLARARNVGPVTFRKLVRVFGSAEASLAAPRERLLEVPDVAPRMADGIAAARNDPWALGRSRARRRARRQDFHARRSRISARAAFWVPTIRRRCCTWTANCLPEDALAVAIVGTRRCSHYGRGQAERLAKGLAAAGFTVVSGLARGIDSAAHAGAINVDRGRTLAVLGNGIGTVYPPENRKLYDSIVGEKGRRGAVLSELPLDTAPAAENFPGRNRIIAGMTLGTVVVEGPETSGALITARYAVDMDREVFAVPGSVESPNSRGPHRLIKMGAEIDRGCRRHSRRTARNCGTAG